MSIDPELRARRGALVREHVEPENRHEFDVTMTIFAQLGLLEAGMRAPAV